MPDKQLQKLNKANELIFAKYSVDSILENRIIALVLFSIQCGNYALSENNNLIISFSIKALKKYCNVSGNGYFQVLNGLQSSLRSRWIGYTDYENKKFKYSALFVDVELVHGVFTITVNGELKKYLIDITSRGNYTPLSLYTLMSLKSNYSIRLYEILRKSCFPKNQANSFTCRINTTELKLMLGVYKIDDKDTRVTKELSRGVNTDFNYIESLYTDDYYSSFQRFNNKILAKAVKEVNDKSDIQVEYEQIKEGRGGKTVALLFTCQFKENNLINTDVFQEIKCDDAISLTKKIFEDIDLSDKDFTAIAKAADYDTSKLIKARSAYDNNNGRIDNVVAWLIAAIKNNYTVAIAKKRASTSSFDNFNSRNYDFDALMQEVIQ